MTQTEALRLALEALEMFCEHGAILRPIETRDVIKAALEAKDEPVAVWELFEDGWDSIADPEWMESLPVGTKLYTTPPQRTWVGLTEKEILECRSANHLYFYKAIEAKLKEKNT